MNTAEQNMRGKRKTVKDQLYKGKLIQIRREFGWSGFIDGQKAVSGQSCQYNAFRSCAWLIDAGRWH